MEEEQQQCTSDAESEVRERGERMEERAVSDEDDPQEGTSSTASGQSTIYETAVSENHCRGCEFEGKSLRGHLKRTKKHCLKLYTEEEINWLEKHAKCIKKEYDTKWKRENKDKANEHEKRRYHKTTEKEKEENICNICDKTLSSKSNLERHVMQTHNKLPDEPLSSDEELLREKNEVDNTKCSICEENFADKFKRDRHIREVHSSLGRIKCTDCNLTFQRWESMSKHRVKVHPGSNARDSILDRDESKKCGICEKVYFDISTLNRHMKDIHGGVKIHGCEECSAHYSRKEDLENHVKKGKHYQDGICAHCEERIVIKSETAWREHFTKEPRTSSGTTPSRSGKETCVNKLKKQR